MKKREKPVILKTFLSYLLYTFSPYVFLSTFSPLHNQVKREQRKTLDYYDAILRKHTINSLAAQIQIIHNKL